MEGVYGDELALIRLDVDQWVRAVLSSVSSCADRLDRAFEHGAGFGLPTLSRFPDVGAQLGLNYWCEGYSGPESLHLEELVERATSWKMGSSVAVGVVADLEERLPAARLQDEEWPG